MRGCANSARFEFFHTDTRNFHDLEALFRKFDVQCVFHLAGQVAMTTSLENPRRDFEVNVVGTINVLDCVRLHAPEATVVYASSNKVYGELDELDLVEKETRYEPVGKKAIDERAGLAFFTPYGCSKGAADQYMLEYARSYGVNAVVFRHSTIYGGRQISSFDQGWVGWFCQKALDLLEDPASSLHNQRQWEAGSGPIACDGCGCLLPGGTRTRGGGEGTGIQYWRRL